MEERGTGLELLGFGGANGSCGGNHRREGDYFPRRLALQLRPSQVIHG